MKFRHHKYTWTKPFGSPRHMWEFVGPMGGVHFTVFLTSGCDPSCGLEFHHTRAANYRPGTAPDHTKCWLTGEPCWHDGTSMYASETLWPMIEPILRNGDHETIFRILEGEYDGRFGRILEAV